MFRTNNFKKELSIILIPKIYKFIVISFGLTCRKTWLGLDYIDELKAKKQNFIYSLWHNNVALTAWALRDRSLTVMTSSSKDGEMISRALESMGNFAIRGSTSKGGIKALMEMIKVARKGGDTAITPDGPRGPKYALQGGTISLAQKAGVPLVPFHIDSTDSLVFERSWDQHKLAKPFSRIVLSIGKPFWVPPRLTEDEFEETRLEFERAMMENVEFTESTVKKLKENNEI